MIQLPVQLEKRLTMLRGDVRDHDTATLLGIIDLQSRVIEVLEKQRDKYRDGHGLDIVCEGIEFCGYQGLEQNQCPKQIAITDDLEISDLWKGIK